VRKIQESVHWRAMRMKDIGGAGAELGYNEHLVNHREAAVSERKDQITSHTVVGRRTKQPDDQQMNMK
jgi:hypothetical protein